MAGEQQRCAGDDGRADAGDGEREQRDAQAGRTLLTVEEEQRREQRRGEQCPRRHDGQQLVGHGDVDGGVRRGRGGRRTVAECDVREHAGHRGDRRVGVVLRLEGGAGEVTVAEHRVGVAHPRRVVLGLEQQSEPLRWSSSSVAPSPPRPGVGAHACHDQGGGEDQAGPPHRHPGRSEPIHEGAHDREAQPPASDRGERVVITVIGTPRWAGPVISAVARITAGAAAIAIPSRLAGDGAVGSRGRARWRPRRAAG